MRVLLAALAASLVFAAPASAVSPDIVVSQVYGGGGNANTTLTNDFIELYNRGPTAVDVTGWSVQYAASAGTSWQVTALTGSVAAGGHYLVQEASGGGGTQPLPTPDATGSIAMSATAGKVALVTDNVTLSCGADCDAAPTVRDFVGYGTAANDFETAPTPTLSATTAALRAAAGIDTDNNSADFTVAAPNPRNSGGVGPPPDTAPTVVAVDPPNDTNDVALDRNLRVRFSEPVDVTPSAFTITCSISGQHAFTLSGASAEYTLDPTADFVREDRCRLIVHGAEVHDSDTADPPDTMAGESTTFFNTLGVEDLRIHDIQGARHRSPYENRLVTGVPGVVTAASSTGIWVQDAQPDGDAGTSEGIFLFSPSARPPVGTAVVFSGLVQEFKPASWGPESLSLTEISRPTVTARDGGSPIAPTVIGQGGRVPPNRIIDNDSTGDVDTNPVFDPQQDGIDFHESIEGMLVQFNDAVATGPQNDFGEVSIIGDNGRNAGLRTPRGGVIVGPNDFNPERFILDDGIRPMPTGIDTGDKFSSPIVAVADYSFDNFKYYPLTTPTATGSLQPEVTQSPNSNELAIASFNVENLAPTDPQSKFDRLAGTLVHNLQAPDVVAVEEIQDNDGAVGMRPTDSPVVAADVTWTKLITAITAAGGPAYEYRQIDPVDDQDGGAPGGNIRQGFLFRTDRGLAFVDRKGGTSTNSTEVVRTRRGPQLTFSPGRIKPADPAFNSSRKPLAGEFTWKGKTVIVVANHFNSKGGDDPLFGHLQPPVAVSETQRHAQARIVNGFARDIQRANVLSNYVVLGDINDFEFSETVQILQGLQMLDLYYLLPPNERYSYVFEGNSQALDHILVSLALLVPLPEYDSVHVNSEFEDQQSDHDPQVARLKVN